VLESGILREEQGAYVLSGPLPALAIPPSLQASLASRLDRLAPIRNVAQIGAALGREFSYNIVGAVMELPDAALRAALDRLVAVELVYQRGTPPDSTYGFRHALVQDAAYETLLRSQRVLIHARITDVLERQFPEMVAQHPEFVAHHATQANLWAKAVRYHLDAAHKALARSAAAEACGQIQKGQALLEHLDEDEAKHSLDYRLQGRLADALKMLKGWMAPEVGAALTRLREHPGRQPNSLEDFKVSVMLWGFYWRVDLRQALLLVEQMMNENEEHASRTSFCHFCLGSTKIVYGDFEGAKRSLLHFVEHCRDEGFAAMDYNSGLDTEGLALGRLGIAHLALGDADEARRTTEAGIVEARRMGRPFSVSTVLSTAIYVYSILRDVDRTAALAQEGWSIAQDQKFAYLSARIEQPLGWVDVMQGRIEDGVERIERATAAVRAMRGRVHNGYFLCLLAACHLRAGQIDRAGDIAAEATTEMGETDERWRESEAWRILGDVKLASGRNEEAEVLYRRALEIAGEQHAKLWQLQAAISLARLLASRGDHDRARASLLPIFDGMTEGSDIPDMVAARQLLTEISTARDSRSVVRLS
jgi:tetratricopeptide (TPR) repeat protein